MRPLLTLLALATIGCGPAARAAPEATGDGVEDTSGDEGTEPGTLTAAPDSVAPLRITFLYSGQGDCALVQCPNGSNIMIDCGSAAAPNTSRERVRGRLDALLGDEGIDVLVLTHPDRDHYDWLEGVLGERDIARVVHSRALSEYTVGGFAQWIATRTTDIRSLPDPYPETATATETEASQLFDCGDFDVRVLAANIAPTGSNANDDGWISNTASIVLRLHREVDGSDFTAILTGDATFDTERAMLAAYANEPGILDADLLRVGHHGTDVTSSSDEWFAATTARIALVSAGHHGSFRHPRCSVIERVIALESMDTVACHEAMGGNPHAGGPVIGSCDGNWCTVATETALCETYTSGDVTVEFDGQTRVTTERGASDGCVQ